MDLIQEIAMLERGVSEHIKEWERFFSGLIKVPPQAQRERIARRLRRLSELTITRRSEQFRVEQLQHRFMTYSQNWERMLREREEGRGVQTRAESGASVMPQPGANEPPPRSVDESADDALFDRYVSAKVAHGLDVRVDREAFEEQIAEQRAKIEGRLGRRVRFDVEVDDGKVRVVARKTKDRG